MRRTTRRGKASRQLWDGIKRRHRHDQRRRQGSRNRRSTASDGRATDLAAPGPELVLYFYPKDDTSGCTREAQDFTALADEFEKAGARVLGVSGDPMKKHDKFIAKYDLKVPLATDADGRICEAFGTWVEKSMYGRKYMGIERATFLIDRDGRVAQRVAQGQGAGPCRGGAQRGTQTRLGDVAIGSLSDMGTVYLVCDWTIRIAMLLVVPLRRPPEATRSWLLLVFFLPLAGLLLFLAIGRTRFPAWRRARFASLSPFLAQVAAKFDARSVVADEVSQSAQDLVAKLGGWPAAGGNSVLFLDDYDEVTNRLVADIDGARQNVRLLAYILADDATGRRVIEALGRAVKRGVSCHVLVDPVGSHHWVAARSTCSGSAASTARACHGAGCAGAPGATCATIASCS